MQNQEIAYFGKKGSFASLVAKKRYSRAKLVAIPSASEVVKYVKQKKSRLGIVPIENSSGGVIPETVDTLIEDSGKLIIREELGIHVKLALLGRNNEEIKAIYSHFAPLHHCEAWLKKNYPAVELCKASSTSEAAKIASEQQNIAALSTKDCAEIYSLDVLEYPVLEHVENVTQFFTLGHEPNEKNGDETSLIVALKNEPGSLYEFLKPFAEEKLNLKRIVSRNIVGHPNTYMFFLGLEADKRDEAMQRALKEAKKHARDIHMLGSYPTRKPYFS